MRAPSRGCFVLSAALLLLLSLFLPVPTARAQSVVLVATNTPWRSFKGTAEPSPASPAAWRTINFAEATWSESRAPFWYGEAALFRGIGTEIADMQNNYSTLFLRKKFNLTNPAAFVSLELLAMCDDGFVAWINGTRVASFNAPTGEPAFNSLSSANAAEPVTLTPYALPDLANVLVTGDNVLAVQVFNTSLGSSDIVFDALLRGTPRASGPPTIAQVTPTPGPLTNLTSITIVFSEPVQGVRADDFLVNGASALAVTGTGTTYTFSFLKPPFGPVGISFVANHTIQDFESPPRRFENSSPGAVWTYELVDPDGPSVATRLPIPNSSVSALDRIEVTFDKAVVGLDAADLTLNGQPAIRVTGVGAGPYLFEFDAASPGPATVAWIANHGIASEAFEPHAFKGGSWRYVVDPAVRPAPLVITEFMAENFTAVRDEDQDPEDWIEIRNPTAAPVDLAGWSLSNSSDDPGQWVFPSTVVPAHGYLVVFASAKDRRPGATGRLHTNFKLNPNGGYLGLFGPELPRTAVSEVTFGDQGPDYSYGRELDTGAWRYFKQGSAGAANGVSPIVAAVEPVHFSVPRGFFGGPFNLALSTPTPGAFIRFTTNGSPPSETVGFLYTNPIPITANRVIRAAAFASNALPARVATHSYLVGLTSTRLRLPALSLVTDTNNLYGRNGIMEVSPRNTTKRGAAWERPVSAEYIVPADNGGFQTDCGIRVQGGDYVRGQYNYRTTSLPFGKYSFRLYFRGEYGQGRLEYPLFPGTTQQSFDTIVLRAGMNDHTNPYLIDEFVRSLARDLGQPAAVGTFVHLFLNGVYKGYYNPTERIDVDFLRAYHGGGTTWDVMAQFGEVREGDANFFNTLRDFVSTANLALPDNYRSVTNRLDIRNFVDYLCPLIYVDNDDWPHNNWRAARERVEGGRYRYYVWDAEWACGVVNGHSPSWNTIQNQLSSTSPPWGGTDIQKFFLGLRKAPEFRLFFADRVHKHFFNGGALTDERIRARYAEVTNRLNGVVSGFNNAIATTWIPQRRRNVLQHFDRAGLLASSNAPAFAQHGGRVPPGFALTITNLTGPIYVTTNGTDPRLPFTGAVAPDARRLTGPLRIDSPLLLRARSLDGTNWSALTEATFDLNRLDLPVRFGEIMYHPIDGDAFEFLEIANLGAVPLDPAGWSLAGVTFRFPEPCPPLLPGARWILANDASPTAFAARYPGVAVAGWFDGSLANAGERLELVDRNGRLITRVEYRDSPPWPAAADGTGPSLEFVDIQRDPDDPAAWMASPKTGGTPGTAPATLALPAVRLSEIAAGGTLEAPSDWIELLNTGTTVANLRNWSLTDGANPRKFVFPADTQLAAGAYLRVHADSATNTPGLHTGFGLDLGGETIALYDAHTNRIDAVTLGPGVRGFSVARLGTPPVWTPAEPTPGSPNEPASLAPSSALALNEWQPNDLPGNPDWIEIHNTDATLPASLTGLYVGTSNALHHLQGLVLVPPSGFVTLLADANPGPDHLGFKLPALGDAIILYDRDAAELQRVTYRQTPEGISSGRVPDGSGAPVLLPGTGSPGASNYLAFASGPKLNEFMAHNTGASTDPNGVVADWIELRNPTATAISLTGASLGVGKAEPRQWVFPAGTTLPANGYRLVWCQPDVPASTNLSGALHLGRGLPAEGSEIWLFDAAGRTLDTVRYGAQLENQSAGRARDGETWTLLASPSPAARNDAGASLADPATARLNEWFASGSDSPDWFEVANPGSLPLDLGGCRLTDDPSLAGLAKHFVAPLTFVAGESTALWYADGKPELGPDHVGFRLDAWGETLRLYSPNTVLIDSIDIDVSSPGVSVGRLPDGTPNIVAFPASASPGLPNWLPHDDVVINEVLAHTDPPLEDAIELANQTARPLDLSGWYLSNDGQRPRLIRLPANTVLPAGGLGVIYEWQFNGAGSPDAFTLNSAHGDDVWLSEADAAGQLTGRRAHARIDPTANAESYGRHRTSVGWDFAPQSRRTFGQDLPTSLVQFRTGTGLPNAYPRVGPVVFSEIHYRPLTGPATNLVEDPNLEFLELHNPLSTPLPLFDPRAPTNTWRLRGGVEFEFPTSVTLAAGGRLVLLNFAPTNTVALAAFRQTLGLPANTPVFGPFRGRLANQGDALRLERPDTPQAPPHPDAGFVPWLLVERVEYAPTYPWPAADDGSLSLQRRRAAEYGNDPANWIAATPTPGTATLPPATDRDFDGLPNDWELTYQLNPDDPADAALDADGDGLSNLAEFIAGTSPRDAGSALRLEVRQVASTGLALRFFAVAQRSYSVLQRADAGLGAWRKLADFPAEGADHFNVIPLDRTIDQPRFYRVVTPAQP